MVETAFIETQSKYWDYQANLLRVESDIDTTISTVDVTVYQDPDATGTIVNEDTVTLSGGYEELSISGFEEAEGGEYWMRVDFEYDEGISQDQAPSIMEATVSTDNVQEGYYETTSVNWDFEAQTVETVSTLDTDTAGIEITVQQQADTGDQYEESIYPEGGEETHTLNNFISYTGDYNTYINMAAVIDQSDQRVGNPSLDSVEIYPEGGIISGIVTDDVDSRVIGATIRAINVETGEMHVTETNGDGIYIFRGLEEAEYHVTGEFGSTEDRFNAVSKPFIDVFEPRIPSSAIEQFNAQSAFSSDQDGQAVDEWVGERGEYTATGAAPTVRENSLNGFRSLEWDGAGDILQTPTFTSSVSQPIVVYFVVDLDDDGTRNRIHDGIGDFFTTEFHYGEGNYIQFAGGNASEGGTPSTGPVVGTSVFDGTNTQLRINGEQVFSGDVGSNSLDGITIGNTSGGGNEANGYIGFLEFHNGYPSSSLLEREREIADMWGLTI